MAIKVPIISEFNSKGVSDAEKALSKFGVTSTKQLAKAAAGFAALAVAGAQAFKSMDAGYDAIVAGTGATGKALQALKDDANEVARQVPNSFAEVGVAIAEVNTRLGLTGAPLQDLTKRFLDLSRVTGVDVKTAIADTTRVFGDWGVEAADQAATMDVLFAATQQTGIGIDRLSALVVQFGAPLRQMGFSLEESIAMFGKFEKEGVNIETVMSGLRMGLGKMAKAGEEPVETFGRVVDAIKAAGSTGEANAIALEAFGQRAGPDMAAAIREGRFELDELVDALGNSEGALDTAAEETLSANDRFAQLGNQLLVASIPALEMFGQIAEIAVGALTKLPKPLQAVAVGLVAVAVASKSARAGMLAFGKDIGKSTRLLGLMGPAAGVAGIAMLGMGLHAKKSADEVNAASEAIEALNEAADEQLVLAFGDALAKGAIAGGGLDDSLNQIADTSPGVIARMIEMEDANGGLTAQFMAQGLSAEEAAEWVGKLRDKLAESVEAHENATESAEAGSEVLNEQADAVADAEEAWQAWADTLLQTATDAQQNYDDMVAAAEDWADGIRDTVNRGTQSFYEWDVTSETTAADFLRQMQLRNIAATNHETNLATVARSVQSGLVSTGKVTEDEATAFIAEFAGMEQAGVALVEDMTKHPELIEDIVMQFVTSSENSSDGMLGAYDPVAAGLDKRMAEAKGAMDWQLRLMKSLAEFQSAGIGSAIPEGVIAGIEAGQGALNWRMRLMISQAVAAAKAAAESNSPSKLFEREVGESIVDGVAVGIDNGADGVAAALEDAVAEADDDLDLGLFGPEVGEPLIAEVAEGVEKEADQLSDALSKAIDDAKEVAVDAAHDLVDEVSGVLDGLWDDIDAQRSLEDLQSRYDDALADESAAKGKLSAAELALAQARWAGTATAEELLELEQDVADAQEDVTDAIEKREDAAYRLLKATQDNIEGDEDQQAAWEELARQAGLTTGQIYAMRDAYLALAAAKREAGEAEAAANQGADRASKIKSDWDYAVNAGWVMDEDIKRVAALAPAAALNEMAKVLNRIQTYFGFPVQAYAAGTKFATGGAALVGEQGPEIVEMPHGAKVTPNSDLMTAAAMRQAIVDGMLEATRRIQQMERAR